MWPRIINWKLRYMKSKIVFVLALILLSLGSIQRGYAQKVALKTNLLYDATATANLGVEFGLGKQWTMDISGNYNGGWNPIGDAVYEHILVQPEFRYWFCNRFAGHFVAFHFSGGTYTIGNIENEFIFLGSELFKLSDHIYDGTFFGAGVAYGYDVVLGRHFNLELEVGFGVSYCQYDQFKLSNPTAPVEMAESHYYIGPTKAALALVYLF